MIEIKNLSKVYNGVTVLNDVSFEIVENSITSIIGPNGAGKSTVLSIISRLMQSYEGEVIIDDLEIKKWNKNELSKTISILRQENNIELQITVKELVSFGRFPYSSGKLSEKDLLKVEEALVYMDLKSIENKYLNELSGGQKQRAYIALTLAQDTKYIFLDEPLNNLDMKNAVQMMNTLRRLVIDLQKTIVIVIHDINFASVYSDYVLALKDGVIHKMDNTKEVMNKVVLENLYEMKLDVQNINDKNICIYF